MRTSDGVLSDPSGSLIIKPCKPSEIDFYQSTSAHPDFCRFIPEFMGQLSLTDKDPAQAAAALMQSIDINGPVNIHNGVSKAIAIDNDWKPSNGGKITTDCAIAMENVAYGFKKPNILDVKLGARLWADDAPPEKRAKLDKVASETTSKALGFRVAGMRTWQGSHAAGQQDVSEDGYRFYDKKYGRAFTAENVVNGFAEYFGVAKGTKPPTRTRKVINRFIGDLQYLKVILEDEESRMYSASLLFVYEGDQEVLDAAFVTEAHFFDARAAAESHKTGIANLLSSSNGRATNGFDGAISKTCCGCTSNGVTKTNGDAAYSTAKVHTDENVNGIDSDTDDDADDAFLALPKIQVLKLIDFAHAQWTPGQGKDRNLLYGIENVIKILHELVPEKAECKLT